MLSTLTAGVVLATPAASGQPPETLDQQIAVADADLKEAQTALAKKFEAFSAAEQRHQRAEAEAKVAAATATRARAEAEAAASKERATRQKFDEFASASYDRSTSFSSVSVAAYLGSDSPSNLLERAGMLDVMAGEYNDTMVAARHAVDKKTRAERTARSSLDKVERNRHSAAKAKDDSRRAYRRACDEQGAAQAETKKLAHRRAALAAQRAEESAPSESTAGEGESTAAPNPPAAEADSGTSGSSGASPAPASPAPEASQAPVSSAGVVKPTEGTLTSTYGARWGSVHYGIDIANSIGTPIRSAMAGEVIDSGPASGFGLWVRVQHDNGLITVYGHINESLVSVGQRVAAGEQIATLGNRGESTGPHLHFEVHQDGNKIDPLPWLRANGVNI
ncbi:peptidoglycan DD-metalloendopeptidase family protein [Actinophytocola sediminis]